MSRPLLISDCDEVLLHMVSHFGAWLGEAHAIDFMPDGGDFSRAMRRRADGALLSRDEMWPLLDGFFVTEMHRQTLVPGAAEALTRLAGSADIVILTNLADHHHAGRCAQLAGFGIRHRVVTNQGGKGAPVAALLAEYRPSVAVFIDDLAHHHHSVARHAPAVHRLHMISEPTLAAAVPPAPDAHARIDAWPEAEGWIAARFAAGAPAGA
ncbi:HAD family hydrolase [Sphingomonas flavalba]|uniref:HAD family hydrolase n=1 Tax=Sphingomonas flavalba TaxID=2559804 RepID=UPI00109DACE0|nr:HAD family hydrolase [Sphingomonas flavalba]